MNIKKSTTKIFLTLLIMITVLFAIRYQHEHPNIEVCNGGPAADISITKNDKNNEGYSIHTPYEMLRKQSKLGDDFERIIKNSEKQRSLRANIKTMNNPVDFYGRVLDQYGNAIPSVSISCQTMRTALLDSGAVDAGTYVFTVKTDAEGLFSIKGFSAINFSVKNLEREGYIPAEEELTKSTYSTEPGKVISSASAPKIFHMWKLDGEREPVLRDMHHCRPFNDGTAEEIKINQGNESLGSILITVKVDTDSYSPDRRRWNWSFTAEVPDGGILLTDAPMPYLAPESGYASKIYLQMNTGDPNWNGDSELTAYVASGNPLRYSRMVFKINTDIGRAVDFKARNRVHVDLLSESNPSGSRLLIPAPRHN